MKINISHKTLLDIINLHYKVFYPIKEFVGKKDFLSIIYNYRTINNTFFPMPIYLNIKEKEYRLIKKKKKVKAV
jgi:ATP sulfurylase